MDELLAEKEQEKSVVSEVKDHLKVLKEAKVQNLSVQRLKKLREENKIWPHMVSEQYVVCVR